MRSICLITFIPNKVWCDFLNSFSKYKIFIVVDNNNFDLYEFKMNYTNITFIQVEDITCELHGYRDTNFTLNKLISGLDKALYYFGENNSEFVWFIEDDVFFNHEDTLLQLDHQYGNSDLLSNKIGENSDGNKTTWHWNRIHINYAPPYYSGMMCAVRVSNRMNQCIRSYANEHKTLFFLEALFPTIAIKNNLIYHNPDELNHIHYRDEFKEEHIDKNHLYHPVKDLNDHIHFRKVKG